MPLSGKDQLTGRQAEVLAFLVGYIREHSYPPALRDIMAHFSFRSAQGALCHLQALEQKGYITRTPGGARKIKILKEKDETDA